MTSSTTTTDTAAVVGDDFEQYFTDKLWALIPTLYRSEDAAATNPAPGALRALVELMAAQAAALRRSQDRLWEDEFIETCAAWVIPYIGDLVGTRLVSALNTRGRRVDVAKTIYYRRRAGTPALLEELIGDITGWEGTVVEMFRRLARAWHGLDPAPGSQAGLVSETPPGGTADLRRPRAAQLAGGPFDEYHHTPDVRRNRGGVNGRHDIDRVALHLYRMEALALTAVTPLDRGGGSFTFDPSGRAVPLFMPRHRSTDWAAWTHPREWDLPSPIRCRLLGDAAFEVTELLVRDLATSYALSDAAQADLRAIRGIRFARERRLRDTIAAMATGAELAAAVDALLAGTLVDDCGRAVLLDRALAVDLDGTAVAPLDVSAANLADWTTRSSAEVAVDPERGRILFPAGAPSGTVTVDYHAGAFGEIGAGTYDRSANVVTGATPLPTSPRQVDFTGVPADGAAEIVDSATYSPVGSPAAIRSLVVQAADGERPYLLLTDDWVLDAGEESGATLTLDGLWLGGGGHAVVLRAQGATQDGDYARVVIRSCTLDPGDTGETDDPVNGSPPIGTVSLVIDAAIQELVIDHSIVGPIRTTDRGMVERLEISDSIVQSLDAGTPAIHLIDGEVDAERVTALGALTVHRLHASELLATGVVDVVDNQHGCFRFSAAPDGSRLPSPYEHVVLTDTGAIFLTERCGQPGYAVLADAAGDALQRGAENGAEIGAFNEVLAPIKLDSLRAKVEEFLPFGLVPLFIQET